MISDKHHPELSEENSCSITTVASAEWLRSARIEDVSVQAAMQPWIGMEYFQLSRGRQVADIQSLNLGAFQVVRERQCVAVQKLGTTPANLCTISFCTPAPAFRFSSYRGTSAGDVFLMPENTAFDLYVPEGAETTYVSLDQEAFLRSARALNPRYWDKSPQQVAAFRMMHQAAFGGLVSGWFAAARTTAALGRPFGRQHLQRNVLQALMQLVSRSSLEDFTPPAGWRSFRICRKAKMFIEEWDEDEGLPTVVDLCIAAGVSERTLQYAFRDYVGMSPVAYLRCCRLNAARAALLYADPHVTSVTDVAMRFDFHHLGRFSGHYKHLFGEAPSVTLIS